MVFVDRFLIAFIKDRLDYVYRDIGVFDNVPGYSLNIIF